MHYFNIVNIVYNNVVTLYLYTHFYVSWSFYEETGLWHCFTTLEKEKVLTHAQFIFQYPL